MQVKIYAAREHVERHRAAISDAIHATAGDVLGLPDDKRFHRFVPLDRANFIHPEARTVAYTIIEISLFEGRSEATLRTLLKRLMTDVAAVTASPVDDVEITIFETPRARWGIRGRIGDELALPYDVDR